MVTSNSLASNPFDRAASAAQQLTQSMRQEFEQLGRDLQTGNLKAAQSDFATIQQSGPFSNSSTSTSANTTQTSTTSQSLNSVRQAFNQLAQDLRTGNLSAARQDYSTLQQDLQKMPSTTKSHAYQLPIGSGLNAIGQLVGAAGSSLQGGYLSGTLQAYSLLAQDSLGSSSAAGGTTPWTTGSVSITA